MKKRIITVGAATLISLNMIGCTATQPIEDTHIDVEVSANESFEIANGEKFEKRFMNTMDEVNKKLKANMDIMQSSINDFIESGDIEDFKVLYSKVLTLNQEAKDTEKELLEVENTIVSEGFELENRYMVVFKRLKENVGRVITLTDTFEEGMSSNDPSQIANTSEIIGKIRNSIEVLEIMIPDYLEEINNQ